MGRQLTVAADARYFKGTSVQSRALEHGLRHTVRPIIGLWSHLPFDLYPPNLIDLVARLLPVPEGTRWRAVKLPRCRAELVSAKDVVDLHRGNPRAVLYFHGGAFLTCGLNTHRRMVARISAASGQPVFNVDYRQMPRESITTSIEDAMDGLQWLLDQGYKIEDITLAGDSAGGYVAFSVARLAIDRGIGRVAGVVALSPLLQVDSGHRRSHRNAHRCQTFPLRALERFPELIRDMDRRKGTPGRICPVDMDVADLPPALIQVGSRELMLSDAEIMANRLVSAGVPCDLQVWERQVHVFQAASSWVPEARKAIAEIGAFIEALAEAPVAAPVAAPAAPRSTRSVRSVEA